MTGEMRLTIASAKMQTRRISRATERPFLPLLVLATSAFLLPLRADQIEMQNGDRYVGTVLSLNTNSLLLHSEVLGNLTLPRAQITTITLRPPAPATRPATAAPISARNSAQPAATARTNAPSEELPTGFRLLAANTNWVDKVTGPFLDSAGPEAKAKFNELFGGLMSGSISMQELRNQARSAVAQVKSLKKETGDDTGMLDTYVTILEKFLGESVSAGSLTNAVPNSTQ
jgi:hypothetical protein